MKTPITFKDPEFVLMCAVDYCINRHSYAPAMLVDEIVAVWDNLKEPTKTFIKKAIKDNNGLECWNKILEL